jgi:hypothetical protein
MPTVTQYTENPFVTLLLSGLAGGGKSSFAMSAPPPIVALCIDKPAPAPLPLGLPGYDPAQVYWKSYPAPSGDLSDDKAERPRNVADEIIKDIGAIKAAFQTGVDTFKVETHEGVEDWPRPATLLVEGADFIVRHMENWVLSVHGKRDMQDFDNVFQGWGQRALKLGQIYEVLTQLPSHRLCNVILTTGLSEETKNIRNDKGKMESVKTGIVDPDMGGKWDTEGPRKFINSFMCFYEPTAKRWFVRVKADSKHRGVRAGKFGLPDKDGLIDVTLDPKQLVNQWNRIFINP